MPVVLPIGLGVLEHGNQTAPLDLLLEQAKPDCLTPRQVVLLDATHTWAAGEQVRHHLAMRLDARGPLALKLTDEYTGETFRHFRPQPGSLWVGDRVYCSWAGCSHLRRAGADFLVRYRRGLNLYTSAQRENSSLLKFADCFDQLEEGGHLELKVWGRRAYEASDAPLRLIIRDMGEKWAAKELRRQKYNKARLTEQLVSFSRYLILLTSSPSESAEQLLELYRGRWQIERYFKELKSLGQMQPPAQLKRQASALGWARTFWVGELLYQRWLGLNWAGDQLRWRGMEQSWRVRQLNWPIFVAALSGVRQPPLQALERMLSAPVQLHARGKPSCYARLRACFAA